MLFQSSAVNDIDVTHCVLCIGICELPIHMEHSEKSLYQCLTDYDDYDVYYEMMAIFNYIRVMY